MQKAARPLRLWCVPAVPVAFPAPPVVRARRATDAHGPDPALWFLNNVACNSLAIISNIEIESLELQRF